MSLVVIKRKLKEFDVIYPIVIYKQIIYSFF